MRSVTEKLKLGAARTAKLFYDRLELAGGACVRVESDEREFKLERATVAALSRRFILGALLSLGAMPFGTYPLGIALVSALGRSAPVAALGALFGTLISGAPISYAISYFVSLFLRISLAFFLTAEKESIAARIKIALASAFSENLYLRVLLSLAPAAVCGIYNFIDGGLYFYDLLGLLFLVLVVPIAVFIFSGAFDSSVSSTIFSDIALGALIFSLVFSLREIKLLGLSLGLAAAFFVTVYGAVNLGQVWGTLASAAAGLAVSPIYVPIFALAGIVASSLRGTSTKIAAAAASVFAAAFGSFLVGVSALTSLFPAAALGSILFSLTESTCLLPSYKKLTNELPKAAELSEIKTKSLIGSIAELSESFTVISQIFLGLAEGTRTPSINEFKAICDKVCDRHCADCPSFSVCWDHEYICSADMLGRFASELYKRGRASERSVPEHIKARCGRLGAILDDINLDSARAIGDRIARERAEIVSLDYEAFASILSDALERVECENEIDAALTKKITESLQKKRDILDFSSVIAWGKAEKQVRICGTKVHSLKKSTKELKKHIENATGERISEPTLELDEGKVNIAFSILPEWECEYGAASCSAGEEECGDSASAFHSRYSRFYFVIGDGMGSGSVAALTSRLCTVYIERLCSAGIPAEKAIKILNSLLRAKSIECSSTIDLAEIDLCSGKLSFYKSGAAPSYVRRGNKLFMISSKTAPIGIMRACDTEQISFELKDGDVVIMLSDGICDDFEECVWLVSMLTDDWDDDLDAMANKLVREATVRNKKKDDISVGIVRFTHRL